MKGPCSTSAGLPLREMAATSPSGRLEADASGDTLGCARPDTSSANT
jgi:hypothetical protein